jgi:putative addiction module component (TIGR02574 family)
METSIPESVPMNLLLALSTTEKIALIAALWDSIPDAAAAEPVPQWQLDELDRREAAQAAAQEPTFSWDEAVQLVKNRNVQSRSA